MKLLAMSNPRLSWPSPEAGEVDPRVRQAVASSIWWGVDRRDHLFGRNRINPGTQS